MDYQVFENRLTFAGFQSLRIECDMGLLDNRMLKVALENSIIKLTAEVDGKMVGMLRVVGDGSYVFIIADLLVHPDYRKHGIGSALVGMSVERVRAMIPEPLWSNVALFAAKGKEKFYRNLGFSEVPQGAIGSGMMRYIQGIKRG